MTTNCRPVVAIYRDWLLPRSQTFVRLQAEALRSYLPIYVTGGLLRDGLALPRDRCMVVNTGGWLGAIKQAAFETWGFAPALLSCLRAVRPVLIHSHFGIDGLRGRFLAKQLGIPLLVTFHGYDATIFPQFPPSRRFRGYLRQRHVLGTEASVLIAVSRHIKQKLLDQGFPREKVIVHYIGVDPEFFQADAAMPRALWHCENSSRVRGVFVGREARRGERRRALSGNFALLRGARDRVLRRGARAGELATGLELAA
jgi:glycosyltransferase involved in cell wall biosynthesis